MQVGSLFGQHHLAGDLGRGHDPAQAQAGGDELGEGAEVKDVAPASLGVEDDQGRQVLPLVAQLTVGVVLHDGHAVAIGQLYQPLPPLQGEGHAGGVVEVGQGVDELGLVLDDGFLQEVNAHALVVEGDGDELHPVGSPGLDGPHVGGLL